MRKVGIVTRLFQAGAGEEGRNFDSDAFGKVEKAVRKLLSCQEVIALVAVVNGEEGNPLAELVSNGTSPTLEALHTAFPAEISAGKLIPFLCRNWGQNAGSATALNEGGRIAKEREVEWILNWSPELNLDCSHVVQALVHAERHSLEVVGFLQKYWWERSEWSIPRNTGALWSINLLESIGWFAPECDGTGKTLFLEERGEVPLAGMEDFHALLRLLRIHGPNLRWGMVGRSSPVELDARFPPGSERERLNRIKVARQYVVMEEWSKEIFPKLPFREVMEKIFAAYHQD